MKRFFIFTLTLFAATANALEIQVLNPGSVPLADVVVYAEPLSGTLPLAHAKASIGQADGNFTPLISVVQQGTAIYFPNKDKIRHNVYSVSSAKRFNLKLYAGKEAPPVIFDKPGAVVIGCNIHDWMLAHILVVKTPYFAKTSSNGTAKLALPAGDYQIKVWHPYQVAAAASQSSIAEGNVRFQLKLNPPPVLPRHQYDPDAY